MVQQSGTAECYSRVVEQSGTAAARKQIRRDGHRRVGWLENASARTMQSHSKLEQCKSEKILIALIVCTDDPWWRALCNAVFVR